MAIRVACQCGKSFQAKVELAGKTSKCPGCGKPIKIPAAGKSADSTTTGKAAAKKAAPKPNGSPAPKPGATGAAKSKQVRCGCGKVITAPARLAGKQVKCPGCGKPLAIPAAKQDDDSLSDLLDEIGYDQEKTKDSCPECGVTLVPNTVICVACGLNLETGKKLKTKSYEALTLKRLNRTKLK